MINTLTELDALIRSENQFIHIDTLEERRLLDHFHDLANETGLTVSCWTAAEGLHDLKTGASRWLTADLGDALRNIKEETTGVFLLLDVKSLLDQAPIKRLLEEIAYNPAHPSRTLVIIGYGLELPEELKRLAVVFTPPLPDADVTREIYYEEVYRWLSERRGLFLLSEIALARSIGVWSSRGSAAPRSPLKQATIH